VTWPGTATRSHAGSTPCSGLIPDGHPKEISAAQATRILESAAPSGAVALARAELAAEFLADLRHLDDQVRQTKKKLAAAVQASRTTLTEVFGAGPVNAGTIIGAASDAARFPGRDHFAACNGTAPAGVSSGNRKACRLPLRGNRRINHAIHMAAITQISHKHSPGRAYYDKKIAEGRTCKDALRSLKRRISDTIYARLQADARQAAKAREKGPGGQPGNDSDSSAAGSHPERQLFGQATPGPGTTIRPAPAPGPRHRSRLRKEPPQPLDTSSKEDSFCMATGTPPICHRRVHNWIIGKHSRAGTGGMDRPPAGGARVWRVVNSEPVPEAAT
jgi:transposase